jgi:hypothetical protein
MSSLEKEEGSRHASGSFKYMLVCLSTFQACTDRPAKLIHGDDHEEVAFRSAPVIPKLSRTDKLEIKASL